MTHPTRDSLSEEVVPVGLLSELGTVAAQLVLQGSEVYAESVRAAESILCALASHRASATDKT